MCRYCVVTHVTDRPLDRLTNEVREIWPTGETHALATSPHHKHARWCSLTSRPSSRKIVTDNDGAVAKPERSRDRKYSALRSERRGYAYFPPADTARWYHAAWRGETPVGCKWNNSWIIVRWSYRGGEKKTTDVGQVSALPETWTEYKRFCLDRALV